MAHITKAFKHFRCRLVSIALPDVLNARAVKDSFVSLSIDDSRVACAHTWLAACRRRRATIETVPLVREFESTARRASASGRDTATCRACRRVVEHQSTV